MKILFELIFIIGLLNFSLFDAKTFICCSKISIFPTKIFPMRDVFDKTPFSPIKINQNFLTAIILSALFSNPSPSFAKIPSYNDYNSGRYLFIYYNKQFISLISNQEVELLSDLELQIHNRLCKQP